MWTAHNRRRKGAFQHKYKPIQISFTALDLIHPQGFSTQVWAHSDLHYCLGSNSSRSSGGRFWLKESFKGRWDGFSPWRLLPLQAWTMRFLINPSSEKEFISPLFFPLSFFLPPLFCFVLLVFLLLFLFIYIILCFDYGLGLDVSDLHC